MYRTILVPLDGSPLGERALPFAAALARQTGAQLHLARVVTLTPPPHLSASLVELAELVETEHSEQYLEQVKTNLQSQHLAVTSVVRSGDAVGQLVAEATTSQADLIVLATADKTMLGRTGFGRVAEGLLGQLTTPIMMVRPWHADAALHQLTTPGGRILVPLDGSSVAATVLGVAQAFARALHADLALLSVIAPVSGGNNASDAAATAQAQEAATRYLHTIADQLTTQGYQAQSEVRVGRPAEEITVAARARGVALVAMATHGQGGRAGSLLGSVANAVVWNGAVPTLLISPDATTVADTGSTTDSQSTQAHGLAAAKRRVNAY